MSRILITGATGNVGKAILKNLTSDEYVRIFKATYKPPVQKDELYFNFKDLAASSHNFAMVDILFLLRPPDLADVSAYFDPLIEECVKQNVKHIVFLSVQGVEKSSLIPHFKIEKLIRESGIPFTFVRPSYFMQNITTIFLDDIQKESMIFVPAGKAPFLWVDVNDVGKAIAQILKNVDQHLNMVYTITGPDRLPFIEVVRLIGSVCERRIKYFSPNLVWFLFQQKRKGLSFNYILVMILLHYSARFIEVPSFSKDYTMLTGEEPTTLKSFLLSNRELLGVTA